MFPDLIFPGSWGPWGSWCKCSKLCGGGDQYRTRKCSYAPCVGKARQTRACNTQGCKGLWGFFCIFFFIKQFKGEKSNITCGIDKCSVDKCWYYRSFIRYLNNSSFVCLYFCKTFASLSVNR